MPSLLADLNSSMKHGHWAFPFNIVVFEADVAMKWGIYTDGLHNSGYFEHHYHGCSQQCHALCPMPCSVHAFFMTLIPKCKSYNWKRHTHKESVSLL